jgi:hypothetical protein
MVCKNINIVLDMHNACEMILSILHTVYESRQSLVAHVISCSTWHWLPSSVATYGYTSQIKTCTLGRLNP